ncbi:fatty acid transporter protein [Xylogone sp. PMI_703]|nr:fatty acid transporter protein [Xylogone sp. PMI_703]
MDLVTKAVAATAGALALSAYLDAKLHIRHDVRSLTGHRSPLDALRYITERIKKDRLLQYHILEEHLQNPDCADRVFLIYPTDGRKWTYKQFYEDVNRAANWLLKEYGIEKGEMVALDGPNSPEYLILWFALDALGACPSYINCNLTKATLTHCVKLCKCRYILYDDCITNLVEPSLPDFKESNITPIPYSASFLASLTYPTTSPPPEYRSGIDPTSVRGLIYTSGTTGLPKGVIMTTGRELLTGYSTSKLLGIKPGDVFYTCLPLYHAAAHALCITPTLHAGSTVILGRKFSHSTFWPEISQNGATHLQYVGELCRYLINSRPHPLEREHKLQLAWGNGIRPDVWEPFRQRFNIPVIHELYAATDGMGPSFNYNRGDFGKHAIGIRGLGWYLLRGPYEKLVKVDVDTDEIIRDPRTGKPIVCKVGEPGEAIHKIMDPTNPKAAFAGYFGNETAGNKRMIKDVFQKGDLWFRSGDMMRCDSDGRVYFVDRLGDTFRWKSENVATNEVADLLGTFPGIAECAVYGVLVPHADGRAGCAAIVLSEGKNEENFDFKGLGKFAVASLPRYAVPIFLRLTPQISYTGTMKMQKGGLKKEGFDVEQVEKKGDKLYWMPPGSDEYVSFKKA